MNNDNDIIDVDYEDVSEDIQDNTASNELIESNGEVDNLRNSLNDIANADKPKSLQELATLMDQGVDIAQHIPTNSVDNVKSFLISYMRSRVGRVIVMTDYLENLEDKLYTQVMNSNVPPSILMETINTINNNLQATMSMMKSLTSDESYLNLIISQTNNIVQNNNMHRSNRTMLDKNSRAKVANIANSILGSLDDIESDGEVSEHTKNQVAKLLAEDEDNNE